MPDYEGWKNRQTWNVAFWLYNDKDLYDDMLGYVVLCTEVDEKPTYRGCISYLRISKDRTPDGIAWNGTRLDLKALNEMIAEMAEE